jgi:hypothetical protein
LTTIHVELDIRVDAFGTDGYDFVTLDSGVSEIGLQATRQGVVEIDEDLASADDGGSTKRLTPTNARLDATWKHVSCTVSLGEDTLSLAYTIDGVTGSYEGRRDTLKSTIDLQLGDCAVNERSTAWRVRFDNVVFDAK